MLKLKPEPTFVAPAPIGIPGREPVPVKFTFRHRTRDELNERLKQLADTPDLDCVMSCVCGWELTDKFTRGNLDVLLQNYLSAAGSITRTYLRELTQSGEK